MTRRATFTQAELVRAAKGTGLVDCETCRRDEPDGDYLYERARDLRMEKETW